MGGREPAKVTRSDTAEICSAVRRSVRYRLMSPRSAAPNAALLCPGWLADALVALNDNVPAAPSKAQVAAAATSLFRIGFMRTSMAKCSVLFFISGPFLDRYLNLFSG